MLVHCSNKDEIHLKLYFRCSSISTYIIEEMFKRTGITVSHPKKLAVPDVRLSKRIA